MNDKKEIRSGAAEYLTFVAATGDSKDSIEMRYEDENIWITQKLMAELYDVEVSTINEHIKKVCEKAKINTPTHGTLFDHKLKEKITKDYPKHLLVSSHIGRRSFATNNYGKIPTSFLMYITGHTTEAMFLTYIGKSNKDIAMELTNYF